jgi:hypothetical protein
MACWSAPSFPRSSALVSDLFFPCFSAVFGVFSPLLVLRETLNPGFPSPERSHLPGAELTAGPLRQA